MISAKRLGSTSLVPAGTTATIYTVPAGRLAILRDTNAEHGAATATLGSVRINPANSASNCTILELGGAGVATVLRLTDTFIVLEEGDAIEVVAPTGSNMDVWFSGHEFILP